LTARARKYRRLTPRSLAATKQARYRERERNGVKVYRFPLNEDDLTFFARLNWVPENRLGDHDAVVAGVLRELRALRERYPLLVTATRRGQ
jgi:hypothetical protein